MDFSSAKSFNSSLNTILGLKFKKDEYKAKNQLKTITSKYQLEADAFGEPEARKRAIKELRDKKFDASILDTFFSRKIKQEKQPRTKFSMNGNQVTLNCGELQFTFLTSRHNLLEDQLSEGKIFLDKDPTDEIISLCLRYNHIWFTPFLWSIESATFDFIVQSKGVTLEGFASPLDFRCKRYCSLYKEDKAFGSLGNFFEMDLNNEICILNPPFTSKFFEEILKKIKEFKATFYIFLPDWKDDKSIQEMISMASSIEILKAGTFSHHGMKESYLSVIDVWIVGISTL